MDPIVPGEVPKFRLLGTPSATIEGKVVANFRSNRIPALIGLLATSPKSWLREVVAATLWPDSMPAEGRHNLRQTILYAKQLLGDDVFVVGRQTLELSTRFETDFHILHRAASVFKSPDEVVARLEQAIMAYQGDFLEGFEDDWIAPIRGNCTRVYIESLLSLADHYLAKDPRRSLGLADLAIALEPYLDGARTRKILALQALGEGGSAHQELRNYRELLNREFGIEPSPEISEATQKGEPKQVIENQKNERPANRFSESDEDAINLLLHGSRPKNGLALALARIPFWVSRGLAKVGIEVIRKSLESFDPSDSSPEVQIAQIGLCELLALDAKLYEAREILTNLVPTIQDDKVRLRALFVYARVFIVAYQADLADVYARQALALSAHSGSLEDKIDVYRAAAETAFLCERSAEAEQLSEAATRMALEAGDWQSFAHVWLLVATIRLRTGRKGEAKLAMETALNELSDKEGPTISSIRVRFYRLLEELGDVAQAERGYRVGMKEARADDDQMGLSIVLTYLGDLLTSKEKYDEALKYHEEALSIRLQIKEPLGEATSQRGIGRVHLACGRLDLAERALKESSRLFTACGSMPGHASALLELAKVASLRDERELALRIALRARHLLSGMSLLTQMTIGPTGDTAVKEAEQLVILLS